MDEPKRISRLFENLYDGNPWLDITLAATLQSISAERAARKSNPERNSIWEITNHLISWREKVLQRITGQTMETPLNNYFVPVTDTSEKAWNKTLENLGISQQKWMDFLKSFRENDLENIYPPNGHTHYEHIHGIIQHDAYHLGQIVLLAKHPD